VPQRGIGILFAIQVDRLSWFWRSYHFSATSSFMHARELADVAGLVAFHGPVLASSGIAPSSAYVEQYWTTSKGRCESWHRALKAHAALLIDEARANLDHWIRIRAVLDEIFISEMLTRVWTALLLACDRRAKSHDLEPIARSVLASHMEARQRGLELLLSAHGFNTRQAVALNRLRRRAERWTDVLIGGLWRLGDMTQFAVEPQRAEDFAADLARRSDPPGRNQAWRLTLISLRSAFQSGTSPIAANPDANARITASILGCFPGELFDSTGVFRSLWMVRLAATASDAQGLITELLQSGPRDARPDVSTGRRPRRTF
jgi:hypothetical protein